MAWIQITEADIQTVFSGAEIEAYRSAALAQGQSDPVSATIAQVVDLVRGYIGAAGITLGASGTIPQKLLSTSLDVFAWRFSSRVGRKAGDSRQTLYQDAIKLLENVAKGQFDIEEPVTTTDETSSRPRPRISGKTLEFDRTSQDGI